MKYFSEKSFYRVFLHLEAFALMRTIGNFGKLQKPYERGILNTKLACYFGLFCLNKKTYLVDSLNILLKTYLLESSEVMI